NRFLRGSLLAMVLLTIVVSFTGGWTLAIDARRLEIIARFLRDIVPAPLREAPSDLGAGLTWAATIMDEGGWQAMVDTVAISILAIVLAMFFGGLLALPAARNLAHPEPFLPGPRPPSPLHLAAWRLVVSLSRSLLIIVRAIPEYVW